MTDLNKKWKQVRWAIMCKVCKKGKYVNNKKQKICNECKNGGKSKILSWV